MEMFNISRQSQNFVYRRLLHVKTLRVFRYQLPCAVLRLMNNNFSGFTLVCVCACLFLASPFCKSYSMYSSLELWETQSNVKR